MNLNELSLPELEAMQEQLLNKLCRVRATIQHQKGTEGIEQQIARLPKKRRAFISTLLRAQGQTVQLTDIEKEVWGHEGVKAGTVRRLVYDLEQSMEIVGIPLVVDCRKRKNGDVFGYRVKRK